MPHLPLHLHRHCLSHVRLIAIVTLLVSPFLVTLTTGVEGITYNEPGGGDGSGNNVMWSTTAPPIGPVVDFHLPDMFYAGKCDPCIARSEYRIQVVVHGTEDDVYWQQVRSAMQQASRDTGVAISIELHDGLVLSPEEIYLRMASTIRRSFASNLQDQPNALIVTLPSAIVHQAVTAALTAGMPVFGFQKGYQIAPALGVLGFVAQDETLAGKIVAQELLRLYQDDDDEEDKGGAQVTSSQREGTTFVFNFEDNSTTALMPSVSPVQSSSSSSSLSADQQKRVVFVQSDPGDELLLMRYHGLRDTLLADPHGSVSEVDYLEVNPIDVFQTVQSMEDNVFLGCPYDMVVLGDTQQMNLVDIAVSAMKDLGCVGKTTLVSFGMSEAIVEAIVVGHIAFTAAPQHYIESVFAVVMTSMFITTGKKLSLPKENKMYLSGPIIFTADNLPTDSVQICREQAFPVCDTDGTAFDSMTTTSNTGRKDVCNGRGCLPRDTIRIGGVLHGVTTDLFWDPVFAAAKQAAVDVGVVLELERLEPQETFQILHAKMAARIRNLCESGVHGLFVTIPDDGVADAIRYCRSLNVPVISINAGADRVEELDILQHIGQEEYNAGYGAGKKLLESGMKEGYCLNHAPGNIVLDERCRGLSDAIAEQPDVVYRGMVIVPDDNQAQYKVAVETAVAERSGSVPETWDDIAFLLGGAGQIEIALQLLTLHPNAILGSFDMSEEMFQAFNEGKLKFGIDQQPFLQGSLPVKLLSYAAYTQEALTNTVIETGPRFVSEPPSVDEVKCESNFFSICSVLPNENMQLIDSWLLAIGYTLVAITIVTALICVAWVVYYREKSMLVRISQPPFLITLCLGCIVSILSIVPMGVQTDYRYIKDEIATGLLTDEVNPDIRAVDASCMMVPWFYSLGFAMVFSSLFSRIWRVQMILKAGASLRRRIVKATDIAPYVAIMFVIVLLLLVAWQIADPFRWEREVSLVDNDGYALESSGRCTSDSGWYFWLAILLFQIVCLFYALVLCFQTKHIQDDLSESSNTFLAVICIFQVNVIALPIAVMVYDDTDVFYFVRTCAVFLQNYTVLCLMFFPKMHRTYLGTDTLPSLSSSLSVRASVSRPFTTNRQSESILRNSRVSFQLPSQEFETSNRNFSVGVDPPPFEQSPKAGNETVYTAGREPGSTPSPEQTPARNEAVYSAGMEPGATRSPGMEPGATQSAPPPGNEAPIYSAGMREPGATRSLPVELAPPPPAPEHESLPFPIPGITFPVPGMATPVEATSASSAKQNGEGSTDSTSSPGETDTATTSDDDGGEGTMERQDEGARSDEECSVASDGQCVVEASNSEDAEEERTPSSDVENVDAEAEGTPPSDTDKDDEEAAPIGGS